MPRTLIYDAMHLAGLGLISAGVTLQWGRPAGLIAGGALLIILSTFDAVMAARQRGPQQG